MPLKDDWETGDTFEAADMNAVVAQVNANTEALADGAGDLAAVATSGDYDDLSNKPTLGTAAGTDSTDYATAAQGALADSATQPGDLATVATSGDYDDLSNRPTLGTAAGTDSTDYATAAQGALADSATQPGDLATVATSGDYDDLSNKPTWSDIANFSTGITHILDPNFTDGTVVRPRVNSAGTSPTIDGTVKRSGQYSMKITAGDGTYDGFYMGCVSADSRHDPGFQIDCTEGQQFYAECYVYVPSGQDNSAGQINLNAYYQTVFSGGGGPTLFATFQSYTMSGIAKDTWVKMSGTITVPSGYELVNPYIQLNTTVTENDVCYVDNFVFRDVTASGTGLATVATTGSYDDLIDKPTLGTAAATDATDYATAAQGALADSAIQSGDLHLFTLATGLTPTSGNYFLKIAQFSNTGDENSQTAFRVSVMEAPYGELAEWMVQVGRGSVSIGSHVKVSTLTSTGTSTQMQLHVVQTTTHAASSDPREYQVYLQVRSSTAATYKVFVSDPLGRFVFPTWQWHATTWESALPAAGNSSTSPNKSSGQAVTVGATTATISAGSGSPESSVTAPVGSIYLRTDGGAGTTLYIKESGTGNTGWVGK